MILNLKHLLLEVTRQCSMACPHCMRGDAEELSMDYAVIDRIFQDTRHIGHLCLTGGEPSLVPCVINKIVYQAGIWRCTIDSFFCATNAKAYSQPFVDSLTKLYRYCTNKEQCVLTATIDKFHEPADPKALNYYRELPFYHPVFEYGDTLPYPILEEGRAKENGIGQAGIPIKGCIYDADFTGFRFVCGDTVYINVKGGVLLNADLSYQSQEDFCIGNLTEDSLPNILSTILYVPRFQRGTRVFRICMKADAGTIAPVKLEDKRYYSDESAAMGAFHQMIHNLQITPVNPAFRKAQEGLKLAIKRKVQNRLAENRLDEAFILYTSASGKCGAVHIYIEHFPLEDAGHE